MKKKILLLFVLLTPNLSFGTALQIILYHNLDDKSLLLNVTDSVDGVETYKFKLDTTNAFDKGDNLGRFGPLVSRFRAIFPRSTSLVLNGNSENWDIRIFRSNLIRVAVENGFALTFRESTKIEKNRWKDEYHFLKAK
jgi:hypothetical protein